MTDDTRTIGGIIIVGVPKVTLHSLIIGMEIRE